MSDIATLGLRLDSGGFITSARQARGALDNLGTSSTAVQRKVQNFATAGGFALGSLAAGGTRDIGTLLRSFSGLGFALGPITGSIALAVASIGIAFFESGKQAKEESEKMIANLHAMEKEFSETAKRMRVVALEARLNRLFDENEGRGGRGVRGGTLGWADIVTNWKNMFRSGEINEEVGQIIERLGALRTGLADTARTAATATRTTLRAVDDTAIDDFDALFNAQMKAAQAAAAAGRAEDIQDAKDYANEQVRILQERFDKEDQIRAAAAAKSQRWREIVGGAVLGTVGAIAARGGDDSVGGAVSGAISGIPAGPVGVVAGMMQGLVGGLLGAADAAQRAGEAMRQLQRHIESYTDSLKLSLGDITDTEAEIRALRRQSEEQFAAAGYTREQIEDIRRRLPGAQGDVIPLFEILDLEERRIEQLKREAAEMEKIDSIVRNAPSGFYVEKYLRNLGYGGTSIALGPGLTETYMPKTGSGATGTGGPTGAKIVVQPGGIVINAANMGPQQLVKAVAQGLREYAGSTGGTGMSPSQALDYVN